MKHWEHNSEHQLIFISQKIVDRLAWSSQLVISQEWQMEDLADVGRWLCCKMYHFFLGQVGQRTEKTGSVWNIMPGWETRKEENSLGKGICYKENVFT